MASSAGPRSVGSLTTVRVGLHCGGTYATATWQQVVPRGSGGGSEVQ